MKPVADKLPRLGKRELICLLSFTCNYVVSFRGGFLFLLVLGIGCVQNQNQNSLLVKRQNDNTSPGDWPRKISP